MVLIASIVVAGAVSDSPIACNLNALSADERVQHAARTRQLKAAIAGVDELPAGYRLRLTADIPTLELLRWVDAERRCCPFLDFVIRLDRENGVRTLELTGRDGVKAFLEQELRR